MDLSIEHETSYRYGIPAHYSIQYLRLAPRHHGNQDVWSWAIEAPEKLTTFTDSYGNLVHTLVLSRQHDSLTITARGHVSTLETNGVLPREPELLRPVIFLRATPLTAADSALEAFVEPYRALLAEDGLDCLHRLMAGIRDRVDYRIGHTDVDVSAAQAFAEGVGVCQDHAHVFIACCRRLGVPARYVSGYLWAEADADDYEAAHAWAEALVPNLGWVGFDVANRICSTGAYVRVATGLDYRDAAPVRGLQRGGDDEVLNVRVSVRQAPLSPAT